MTQTTELEGFRGTPGPWEWDGGRLYYSDKKHFSSHNILFVTEDKWRPLSPDARLLASSYDLALLVQKVANTSAHSTGASARLYELGDEARALLASIISEDHSHG